MDNNLPNDPSNPNNNNNSTPPAFGSNFNPHTNPIDPNNPYSQTTPTAPTSPNIPNSPESPDPVKHEHYSEAAHHKIRDEHGRFIHTSETQTSPTAPTSQTTPIPSQPSNPSNPSFLPPLIEVNQNNEPSKKSDPPLFGFFITNPITYLKKFLNKLIKNQSVNIKVPILTLIIILTATGGYGVGFKSALYFAAAKIFPNSSPVLHRPITEEGTIQKSSSGYVLNSRNNIWELKLQKADSITSLADSVGKQVLIRGNLTSENFVIEVSQIISLDTTP